MNAEVLNNTLQNIDHVLILRQCLENIRRQGIPGATAELGVYKGGLSKLIANELPDRTHYAFDTFSGLPNAVAGVDSHQNGDFNDVDRAATLALLNNANIVIKEGCFPGTAQDLVDEQFALVHLDADTYQSTLDGLTYFYPRLSPGGFLVLDDYTFAHCPGVEKACAEFFADKSDERRVMVDKQLVITKTPSETKFVQVWFDHGLGDCVHFAQIMQLYRRRNYIVALHYEHNKADMFRAAGFPRCELNGDATPYHSFIYDSDFNRPTPECDSSGNKTAFNATYAPLPQIGQREQLWEELVAIDERRRVAEFIEPKIRDEVRQFLSTLPRPIILLHSQGTNFPESKNLPHDTTCELYERLLEGSSAGIVLLDWDWRVPPPPDNGRFRHIARDFGHASTAQLIALIDEAALLIGVDSGPLHTALLTDTPVLGVLHQLYPSCVTLPRAQSAFMTRNFDNYRPVNYARRKRWSILEYAGQMPTAEEIARHALRMLNGPRYLPRGKAGRDALLQHLVRDQLKNGPSHCPHADRQRTFDWLFCEMRKRFQAPNIVETGCQRGHEDWGAGCSTYLFGCYLEGLEAGRLSSVDNSPENMATAAHCTAPWKDYIRYHVSDSVSWLEANQEMIDVLYLDSLDADHPDTASHGLREFQTALPQLHEKSIVIIDDTDYTGSSFQTRQRNSGHFRGKGAQIVPYAISQGWHVAASGYQVVLLKTPQEH